MQVNPQEVSAKKATTPAAELRLVSVEQLRRFHRELDACQKVIWLAGCRPHVPNGFDPAYVTGAQEQLKEIENLIASAAPVARPSQAVDGYALVPIEPTAEMREAFHDSYERYEDGEHECPDDQWKAMIAAAPAQTDSDAGFSDADRLNFMLGKFRKLVMERLPGDTLEFYVEEGVMGDKRYPSMKWRGQPDHPNAVEAKRRAIDLALKLGGE